MEESSSEMESGGTFVEYCYLCDVKMNCAQSIYSHQNGKKHKSKASAMETEESNQSIKRNVDQTQSQMEKDGCSSKKTKAEDADESNMISCIICDEVFKSDIDALQHFKGTFHKSNVESKLLLPAKHPTITVTCNDCNLMFDSESRALHHFKSKTHAKMIVKIWKTKEKEGGTRWCTICSKTFSNDSDALAHYQSKAHTKGIFASVDVSQGRNVEDESVNEGEVQKAKSSDEKSNTSEEEISKEIQAVSSSTEPPPKVASSSSTVGPPKISASSSAAPPPKVVASTTETPPKVAASNSTARPPKIAASSSTAAPLHCDLCSLTFSTEKNMFEHFNGKKHNAKMMQIRNLIKELPKTVRNTAAGYRYNWTEYNFHDGQTSSNYNSNSHQYSSYVNEGENYNFNDNRMFPDINTSGYQHSPYAKREDFSHNFNEGQMYSNINANRYQYDQYPSYGGQNGDFRSDVWSNYQNSFMPQSSYRPQSSQYEPSIQNGRGNSNFFQF